MPAPYVVDLRWRIVWSLNSTIAEVAELFSLSERTVRRNVDLFYGTGDIVPKDCVHGPRKLLGDYEQLTLLHFMLGSTYVSYKMNSYTNLG